MKKIAITGVMGAGKSSVIEILKEYQYTVLDCDRMNDELLLKGHKGYVALVEVFKDSILDEHQCIDRQKMSNQIFTNQEHKKIAEGILHPFIKEEIQRQCKEHEQEDIVFVEVPLLYEIGWESNFDATWVVASEEEYLLERLMKYRGVTREEAVRRLQHQMSQKEKVEKADVVIWNNSNKEDLKQQIYDILVSIVGVNKYGKKRGIL
ncbi:MAG: dephospho-CoA kinase [Longicatena sp.]